MSTWIKNEEITNLLKNNSSEGIKKFGTNICVSDDFEYCLLLRLHDAWEIDREGWRNSNSSPDANSKGRLVLNFYHYMKDRDGSSWFKIFVPIKYSNIALKSNGDTYEIITDSETIIGKFDRHDRLMWDCITGHAEPESEIGMKFNLLKS